MTDLVNRSVMGWAILQQLGKMDIFSFGTLSAPMSPRLPFAPTWNGWNKTAGCAHGRACPQSAVPFIAARRRTSRKSASARRPPAVQMARASCWMQHRSLPAPSDHGALTVVTTGLYVALELLRARHQRDPAGRFSLARSRSDGPLRLATLHGNLGGLPGRGRWQKV